MDDYNDVIIKLYKPGRHNDEVLKATQIAEIFDTVVATSICNGLWVADAIIAKYEFTYCENS